MLDRPTPSRSRSLSRRWRVPAHYLHGAERFDGACVLEESAGPLGLLLWQCERDVRLWATSGSAQRENLFTAGAAARCGAALSSLGAEARPLEGPLRVIVGMLENPLDVSADAVMLACRRIAEWAEPRGATATALTFAQAAALAQPGSAPSAYEVGRLARRIGQAGRAEGWLNRAIVLARQTRDWDTYAAAYGGLGNVNLARGNLPAAERCQLKALRIATQHELPARVGGSLHDLFVIAAEAEQSERAIGFAEAAFRTYPEEHSRRAALAHDVALFWMELGNFRCALPVLLAAWPRLERDQQVVGLANVARAYGALGEGDGYDEFSDRASRELTRPGILDPHPGALLNLARGAASLGRWEESRSLVSRARIAAEEQRQNKVSFEADVLLQALDSDQAIAAERHDATTPQADRFAWEVASSLSAREPTASGV
jgi:tetratricopeptide (TPR) repeat protein